MPALLILAALVATLAAFGLAALRWGRDSRDWSVDGFVSTAVGLR